MNPTTTIRHSAAEIACTRCGSLGTHTEAPGAGPHRAKLLCGDCGAFIRWLPTHAPEVRAAQAAHYRRQWLSQQTPTEKQLDFLEVLGYDGPHPANRLAASDLIEQLKREVMP